MTAGTAIIDVGDVETFDSELHADLDAHADVIRDYMLTSRHLNQRNPLRAASARAEAFTVRVGDHDRHPNA